MKYSKTLMLFCVLMCLCIPYSLAERVSAGTVEDSRLRLNDENRLTIILILKN